MGTFQFQYKSLPSERVYVLDGYISHPINLQQETQQGYQVVVFDNFSRTRWRLL